jgi:hypothetical protein
MNATQSFVLHLNQSRHTKQDFLYIFLMFSIYDLNYIQNSHQLQKSSITYHYITPEFIISKFVAHYFNEINLFLKYNLRIFNIATQYYNSTFYNNILIHGKCTNSKF